MRRVQPINQRKRGATSASARGGASRKQQGGGSSRQPPSVNRPQLPQPGRWVIGKNAVRELMRHAPERAVALYSSLGSAELKAWIGAVASGVTVASDVDPGKLSEMVETDSHQGILAWCLREEEIPLSRYLKESDPNCPSLLVLVDSVNDPQNLGAILRAAECFGADGVIISKNRGCSITPVVTKASVGASELVRTFEVSNLAEALRLCTEHGYWGVVTALVPEASPLATFSFPHRTVMVLGSEGTGVQSLLLRRADFTLKIEQYGMIDSLNVSQATAVLLYQYRCAHPGAKTLVCTG